MRSIVQDHCEAQKIDIQGDDESHPELSNSGKTPDQRDCGTLSAVHREETNCVNWSSKKERRVDA